MRYLVITSLALAGLLAAPAVNAQTSAPTAAPQSQGNTALSNQKLDAAAAAIARVAYLRENYQRQIAQADPAERQKIAEQASGELTKAVNDQGLSVQEYNSIVERAQSDPGVRKKILDRLQPPAGGQAAPDTSPSHK